MDNDGHSSRKTGSSSIINKCTYVKEPKTIKTDMSKRQSMATEEKKGAGGGPKLHLSGFHA